MEQMCARVKKNYIALQICTHLEWRVACEKVHRFKGVPREPAANHDDTVDLRVGRTITQNGQQNTRTLASKFGAA